MTLCDNQTLQPQLPTEFFIRNRRRLQDCLGDNYLAIFAAGRPPRRTADEDYRFFANRSFFYLTGIEQENAVLVLFQHGAVKREILFLPAQNLMQERWTGPRVSRIQAAEYSGIPEILYLEGFEGVFSDLLAQAPQRLWIDYLADNHQANELKKWLDQKFPSIEPADLSPFLVQLRMIKDPAEIACLQTAIDLTGRGINALMRQIRPGMMEYQLWSTFNHALAMEGCLEPAFPTIVAAGPNIFCLHYMNPRSRIQDGDLIQVDLGAMAGGLCADISRVFPANGRFTPVQLEIYQLVRECQEKAFATIKPGIRLKDINDRCREVAAKGLAALGILNESNAVTDYFWHSVSHHLGHDVHDLANREALLRPGMVLTVEPGIYIPERQIGMRLEDDVLVTENGCVILSEGIPREAADIETALQSCQAQL